MFTVTFYSVTESLSHLKLSCVHNKKLQN